MPTELKLPDVGENIETAKVIRVMVHEGDAVEKDQPIIEIETEKATLEVPSEAAGTVSRIHVSEGEEIRIGQSIATLDGGEAPQEPRPEPEKKTEPAPPIEEAAPEARQAQAEARQVGPGPEKEQPAEKHPPEAARRGRAEREEDERRKAEAAKPAAAGRIESRPGTLAPAAPSVRRFARQIGIDINQVRGSGERGRISIEDVKAHARGEQRAPEPARPEAPGAIPAAPPLPDFSRWGEIEERELSNIRRVIGERLSRSWLMIPHVHHADEADVTDLEELRRRRNKRAAEGEPRLTVTAVILKVLGLVLGKYPAMNASLDTKAERLILKRYIHVGVAVDTPRGLLVPVIRDVDRKSIMELAAELAAVSQKARDGKLGPDEMRGGTFTVTNLGGIGGAQFNPIINWPEVGILGVGRSAMRHVMRDGQPQWRLMLPLCLGYDHRVIDGADGARFTADVAAALSDPMNLLLEI